MAMTTATKQKTAFARIMRKAANDIGTPPAFTESAARNVADVWTAFSAMDKTFTTLSEWQCGITAWQPAPVMQDMYAAIAAPVMQPDDVVMCCGFQPYAWHYAVQGDMTEVASGYMGKNAPRNIYHFAAEDITNWLYAHKGYDGLITVSMHIDSAQGWQDVRDIAGAAVKSGNAIALFVSCAGDLPQNFDVNVIASSVAQGWDVSAASIQNAITDVRETGYIRAIAAIDDMSVAALDTAVMEAANYTADAWAKLVAYNADEAERSLWAACKSPVIYE